MTLKSIACAYNKTGNDFVFIKMDTLIERLRRMRALNSSPADIGISQYTCRCCSVGEKDSSKKK